MADEPVHVAEYDPAWPDRFAEQQLQDDGWVFWPEDPGRGYRLWFLRPRPEARTYHLHVIKHDDPHARAVR